MFGWNEFKTMHCLDTGTQSVTMQHISSTDISAEDFHPPSACILPLKAVSSFSSSLWLTYSWVVWGFFCNCLGHSLWKVNLHFLPVAIPFSLKLSIKGLETPLWQASVCHTDTLSPSNYWHGLWCSEELSWGDKIWINLYYLLLIWLTILLPLCSNAVKWQ